MLAPRILEAERERGTVARAVTGDAQAFGTLFHRLRAPVYRVTRAVLGDHDAALDALQETFLKMHRGLARWSGNSSLETWVVRIAVRTAIDHKRRLARHRVDQRPAPEPSHDPRPDLHRDLLLARVRELAARVDGQQGLVLRLRLLGGLSNREIAAHLKLKEPNVRMQLSNAVRRLREML